MKVYTCRNNFEDMMCCIYDAWSEAINVGHDNVKLLCEPVLQQELFDEYIHVEYDKAKYEKVVRSIQKKISSNALVDIYYASLSSDKGAIDDIYRFLIKGFKLGVEYLNAYTIPEVVKILDLKRKVSREANYFREFARFVSFNNVYVCHLEPKSDVIGIVGRHFADRMPSEYWIIIDDNRKYAVVHPKDEENYIRILSDEEVKAFGVIETYQDEYTDMWKSFFDAIAIKERTNLECQRNHFPIWMRKHTTEFL